MLLHGHVILPLVMEFVSEKNRSRWVSDAIKKNDLYFLRLLTATETGRSA